MQLSLIKIEVFCAVYRKVKNTEMIWELFCFYMFDFTTFFRDQKVPLVIQDLWDYQEKRWDFLRCIQLYMDGVDGLGKEMENPY